MSLFNSSIVSDKNFLALRDNTDKQARAAREFIDESYLKVGKYLDVDFARKLQKQFHAHYWELWLALAAVEAGVSLVPRAARGAISEGPDLLAEINGKKYWFEAVIVTKGEGPDKIKELHEGMSHLIQDEAVKLRILNALKVKCEVYEKYINSRIVSLDDAFIIAVNSFEAGLDARLEVTVPRIVKCVLPIGHEVAHIDKTTKMVKGYSHEYCASVSKLSGSKVSTTLFQQESNNGISSVIYSNHGIWDDFPLMDSVFRSQYSIPKPGEDFIFVLNPMAKNPMNPTLFDRGYCYWVEDGSVIHKPCKDIVENK
jgi:hypothetical protein